MSRLATNNYSSLDGLLSDVVPQQSGLDSFVNSWRDGMYGDGRSTHTVPARRKRDGDVERFQWRPHALAMGSLIGNQFIQMLGAECDKSDDLSRQDRYREQQVKVGKSYLAFDFNRELLVIRARLSLNDNALPLALRPLDAELSFDDIAAQGIRIEPESKSVALGGRHVPGYQVTVTICTRRPPKFFTKFEQSDQLLGAARRGRAPFRRRATAMDFAISSASERNAGTINAIPEGPCAFPTFWNTYRWIFDLTSEQYHRLKACRNKIHSLMEENQQVDVRALRLPSWCILKLDLDGYKQMYGPPDFTGVRFSTRVLIEGLIAHGLLRPGDVLPLLQTIKERNTPPDLQDRLLEGLYNEDRIRDVVALVRSKAVYLRNLPPPCPDHLVRIRSVLVTPTRILMSPPQPEASNSVTRRYKDKLDGILRVNFTDEEDRLFVSDYTKQCDEKRPDIGVIARVRRALQHGITVGGRVFYPVASSASQQKDHAMWFIDNKVIDVLDLKNWMGAVKETIVAKHAARMGLPFSTSRSVDLHVKMGVELPDIFCSNNKYCFTDGVGVAGAEVMKEAAKALGIKRGINLLPSAIQFRLGGAKGVLTYCPEKAGDYEIRLRKSNVKFDSKLADLNVVRLAKYQVAFLNRQFIMIMCANRIPEQLMMDLFYNAVTSIKGLPERVQHGRMSKDDKRLISLCSDFPLGSLIRAGFNEDPLILDICSIIECRALQDLKWRARVELPTGVFLIGIADEYNVLREGEVFCQFQENEESEAKTVVSPVIVCRAPALHPGDVRRARAVDRPELRHLKNVIVFSTQGKRDLPNMLGGGDLDGDDYTLIWDPRFVEPLREYEPMDYTAPEPKRVKQVTQADLNENFCQYLLNDVLGQVDNTHLALSDINTPFHADCLALSSVHSMAVDFAKTGLAATLDPELKPKFWPDFMDRDDTRSIYRSDKILGRLFRMVQPDPHFRPSDIKDHDYQVDARISRFEVYDRLIEDLKPIKAQYEDALQYDMRRYKVFEPEIPSGIAIRNKRRKRMRDHNLNASPRASLEPLRDSYNAHVRAARDAAMNAVSGISFRTKTLTPAQMVVRHCYALTYEREHVQQWEEHLSEGKWGGRGGRGGDADADDEVETLRPRPMTSFAWVFWQELVQIAAMDGP